MKGEYNEYESKMKKTVEVLDHDFSTLRAGRANAAVLERIQVDYYGSPTPIAQIASVSVPEPRVLTIQPWDISALKLIDRAIQSSDLGINPQNDGKVIRLVFPQLTEERRRELVRQVHKFGEDSKVSIRNIRRDAIERFKAQKKKSEITEDDMKIIEKDFQELTDKYCKEIDAHAAKKEKELMEL